MTISSKKLKTEPERVPKLPFKKVKYRKLQLNQKERDKELLDWKSTDLKTTSQNESFD